jgi:hypothetical protein
MPSKIPPWAWALAGGVGAYGLWSIARGSSALAAPRTIAANSGKLPGTIFTIVFENKGRSQVLGPNANAPYFKRLAQQFVDLTNYRPRLHPSLPNYIIQTSGTTHGISDDVGHVISGTENIFAQLEAANIPWRAYAESMPSACFRGYSDELYAVRHVPALYYESVIGRSGFCRDRVVPFVQIWDDLPSTQIKYLFITPNMHNDMHDAPVATGDRWLSQVLPRIMQSPGYTRGGVVFIIFDETAGTDANIPAIMISPLARANGTPYATLMDHRTYLATVQDLMGLQRLPGTQGVQSLVGLLR